MKERAKAMFASVLCVMLLSGCESWRRPISPQPTEIEANTWMDISSEDEEGPLEEDNAKIEMSTALVTAREDKSVVLETDDEILSQKLYDLLLHQNELFSEKFDEREYDFLAEITDEQEGNYRFYLWVNFERENEIIVEDEEGTQWNLSIEDSNHLRTMLSDWQ